MTLTNLESGKVGFQINRSVDELAHSIGKRLDTATAAQSNVIVRPRPDGKLIHLGDLDTAKAAKITPYSFLTFETSPGNFQAAEGPFSR
ncbi:hypothetical protein SBA3_1860045 [Candidatus Sulfopaludibacter sp. SbA3]|nr:hypothetical protein SBA3_1860045 [Candidatus Sulfopaludibacter sp. SbA3]